MFATEPAADRQWSPAASIVKPVGAKIEERQARELQYRGVIPHLNIKHPN